MPPRRRGWPRSRGTQYGAPRAAKNRGDGARLHECAGCLTIASAPPPFVPAQAGTQSGPEGELDSRLRGNERSVRLAPYSALHSRGSAETAGRNLNGALGYRPRRAPVANDRSAALPGYVVFLGAAHARLMRVEDNLKDNNRVTDMTMQARIGGAALLIALGAAAAPAPAIAASCIGSCGVSSLADGDVTLPPSGGSYRWISTFNGPTGAGQISGPYNSDATNGSQYKTTAFTATANQALDYYFNFITSDGQNTADPNRTIYQDYAWAQLQTTGGTPVATLLTARTEPTGTIIPGANLPGIDATLAPLSVPIVSQDPTGPAWSPLGSSSQTCWGPGCGYTGWIHSTYNISVAGTYVLVFGVTNWLDTAYDTGLAFTGITLGGNPVPGEGEGDLTATPVPAALPLFASGAVVLGLLMKRRRTSKCAA